MFFYEKRNFGNETHFHYGENLDFSFPVHFHRCFEAICVLDGEIDLTVDGRSETAKRGEAAIFFPNQLHSYHTRSHSRCVIFIFAPELIGDFTSSYRYKLPVTSVFPFSESFYLTFAPENQYYIKSFLYRLCGEFQKYVTVSEQKKTEATRLLHEMLSYIDENYQRECSLRTLSGLLKYDYAYLSKYFARKTGMTFKEYVNQYRITYACSLLRGRDMAIYDVAGQCGYDTIRTFNRNFLAITNMTPTEYRRLVHKVSR